MSKRKKQPQAPKPRNEEWMRGRLVQANRNLTVPNKKKYNRKEKYGVRWE